MAKESTKVPGPLREQEAFLTLAETLSNLIVLIQGDTLVYVNPAGCAMLGRPLGDFVGHNFWDFALPQDQDSIRQRGRSRQSGVTQPKRFVERLRHSDGHDIWVDYSVDVIRLDGTTTTLVTGQDITEQKRAEEALRKSERLFRGLYTQAPVMMWSVGWDGRFREVSDALLQKLGYDRRELLGMDGRDLLVEESRRRLEEHNARNQAARVWWSKDVPLQVRRKDGTILEIQLSSVPELDERGEPQGWICVASDVTEINRAQDSLKKSEAFFRGLFAQSPVMMAVVDHQDRFTEVSDYWLQKCGYARHELIGTKTWDITSAESAGPFRELIAKKVQARDWLCKDVPLQLIRKDRSLLDILLTCVPELDEKGEPKQWLCVAIDLSEINQAQQALRESDERFRAAFQNAGICKVISSPDLKFLQANKAFCDMIGYSESEVLKLSPLEISHPDDLPLIRTMVEKLLSGESTTARIQKRYLHKDGRVLWGDLTTTVVRDAAGKPLYGITEIQDITDRRQAEEALSVSEERFRAAFENAAIGKAITSLDMRLLKVNLAFAEMLGYTQVEMLEISPIRLTHPDDLAESRDLVLRLLSGAEASGRVIKRYFHKSGQIVWGDLTTTLVRDGAGKPAYFVTEVQDVTERKRSEDLIRDREAKLAEAQKVAHVGSWEYFIDENRSDWTEEMYWIFGVDPATFNPSKENAFARFHAEDLPHVAEVVERAIQVGDPFEFDARVTHPNGEVRTLHAIGRARRDASGKPSRLYGIVQDITERKQANELIRDREAKLSQAAQIAKLGYWEWDVLADRVTWSEEMYRIWGVRPEEFKGNYEAVFSRIQPDDAARIGAQVAGSVKDGKPIEFEYRVIRPGGEVRHAWSSNIAVPDETGRIVRMYGVVRDITERKLGEQLLRDREVNLAEAQMIAHIGSWDWDVAKNSIVWTDEMFRILGLDPAGSTATYDGYMNRVHADDRDLATQLVTQALKDGRPYQTEHRIVRDSGEIRSVWVSCRLEKDAAGAVTRMYGIVQDITERKQADEALRTSEQRFRSLYTQAPVMMTAMTPEGRIREVSNYWLKVMGYERQEVIGEDGFRFITPESKEALEESLASALLSGDLVLRNVPLVGVRKDGSTIDVLTTSVLELDDRGQPFGAIVVGVDVSDIKRAEEAVRESEMRYRALVEHAPEAIVVLDVETGKFMDVNDRAERLFGFTREKLLAMGPLDICPEAQPGGRDSRDVAWAEIGRVMRGEAPVFEFVHSHADGREIPCEVRLSRLPATGRILVRATLIDISDRKALQEQVRHAEKMAAIGLLAAGVAHEIGNPLLALSMAAQSLERKAQDEYAQKKLGLIREHIERISKIVRQMSDLARPQSVRRTSCDLNRVLERSVEVVRYDKRAKEVPIEFEPCPDAPFVEAVEDQIMQVCLNLALNALDAMAGNPAGRPRKLRIAARCHRRDGRTVVRAAFKDSGPGIPESARSKIFQPFFTTKDPGKGTGLGLSVSYRIIEEHRGTLAFDCGAGDGTEFYFELPLQVTP